jgi:endonuclease/exonuclease/phosphatase (EEP) superfamily protein YafD
MPESGCEPTAFGVTQREIQFRELGPAPRIRYRRSDAPALRARNNSAKFIHAEPRKPALVVSHARQRRLSRNHSPAVQDQQSMGAPLRFLFAAHARCPMASRFDRALVGLTMVAVSGQALQILPYTRLWKKQVARAGKSDPGPEVSLLAANVFQPNRNAKRLLHLIESLQPDIVLLMETDAWWAAELKAIEPRYPFSVLKPQDNTYGMLLYSRLPLIQPEIRCLVQPDIPSIRVQVRLRDGSLFHFYGVHPRPPGVPTPEGYIPSSAPRDAELVIVAREVGPLNQPVIVAGDFNDVAWSHTTRLFQRLGRLLDPRVGRGLYNTFHADHPLCRFPLDHLFHSEHFEMVDFRRLPHIGSDHFPILATLKRCPDAEEEQEPPPATSDDSEEAQEILQARHQG